MGHDQFFKDFFRTFFRDFLDLFYTDVAERLDFGTLRFLEKELFTDFPEGSPERSGRRGRAGNERWCQRANTTLLRSATRGSLYPGS